MTRNIRGVLLDMDGVLYHGEARLDGVLEFFEWLPWPYLFVTNNSSRTPQQVADRLAGMQIPAQPDQILTSSVVTAQYLKEHAVPGASIYVIGEIGLRTALTDSGFVLTDEMPDYVVVGLDRAFNDDKLALAVDALNYDATFIGTNMDMRLLTADGEIPGTGSIIRAVEEASGKTARVMGKPERALFEMAAKQLQLDLSNLMMIGDNLETDIRGANAAGVLSVVVLTGITTETDIAASEVKPDVVVKDLPNLMRRINNGEFGST